MTYYITMTLPYLTKPDVSDPIPKNITSARSPLIDVNLRTVLKLTHCQH